MSCLSLSLPAEKALFVESFTIRQLRLQSFLVDNKIKYARAKPVQDAVMNRHLRHQSLELPQAFEYSNLSPQGAFCRSRLCFYEVGATSVNIFATRHSYSLVQPCINEDKDHSDGPKENGFIEERFQKLVDELYQKVNSITALSLSLLVITGKLWPVQQPFLQEKAVLVKLFADLFAIVVGLLGVLKALKKQLEKLKRRSES